MPDMRTPVCGLVWPVLTVAYLAFAAIGYRPGAMAVLGLMAGAVIAVSGRLLLGCAVAMVLAAAGWHYAGAVGFLVYIPPLAAFAFMAVFFGRTLRPGSEPLISRVARKEQPFLTADVERHARLLTGAWTACFAALLLAAVCLALSVPLDEWSRWVQVLGVVVPAALFLGEYAYRHYRFPHQPRASLAALVANVVAVFREIAVETGPAVTRQGKWP